jgi:hypothetical protein
MLNIVDEFTRETVAIRVARRLNSIDVIDVLSDLFMMRGVRINGSFATIGCQVRDFKLKCSNAALGSRLITTI